LTCLDYGTIFLDC